MKLSNNTCQNARVTNSRYTNVDMSKSVFADGKLNQVEICFVTLSDAYLHDTYLDLEKEKQNMTMVRYLRVDNCKEGITINGIRIEDLLV